MFELRRGAGRGPMAFVAAFAAVSVAQADTIQLSHEGHASGRLDGVEFPDSAFVIEATADTSDRQKLHGGYGVGHASASISIKGLGTFDFVTSTRTFVSNKTSTVGFSSDCCDLFNGPTNEAFATWDMLSQIGPISGGGFVLQWTTIDIVTSGGVLVLDDADSTATFEAAILPGCYPDFTGDGTLDLLDFLGYVNAFNARDDTADCDQNSGLDLFDFLCFVNAFNEGC